MTTETDEARWEKWRDLRARKAEATTDEEREALAREEDALRDEGVAELLIQDFQQEKEWVWLSFTDPSLPPGSQFLGVSIVEAGGIMEAALVAYGHGCNPGGEVKGIVIPPEQVPGEEYRYRLMSKDELEEAGLA